MTELFSQLNDEDILYGKTISDGSPLPEANSYNPFPFMGRVIGHSAYEAVATSSEAFGTGLSSLIPEEGPVKDAIEETFIRNPYEYNASLRATEKSFAENIAVGIVSPFMQMVFSGGLAGASITTGLKTYGVGTKIEGQSELEALQRGIVNGGMFYVGGKLAMTPSLPAISNTVLRKTAEYGVAGGLFTAFSSAGMALDEGINAEYGKETHFGQILTAENIIPSMVIGGIFKGQHDLVKRYFGKERLTQEQKDSLNTLDADNNIIIPVSDNPQQNVINKNVFEETLRRVNEGEEIDPSLYDTVGGEVPRTPFILSPEEYITHVLQVNSDNFKLVRPPEYNAPLPNIEKQMRELSALIVDELPQERINEIIKENQDIVEAFRENQEAIDTNKASSRLLPETKREMENLQTNNFLEIERQYAIKAYKRQLADLQKKHGDLLKKKEAIKQESPELTDEEITERMRVYEEEPIDELIDDIEPTTAPILSNEEPLFIQELSADSGIYADYGDIPATYGTRLIDSIQSDVRASDGIYHNHNYEEYRNNTQNPLSEAEWGALEAEKMLDDSIKYGEGNSPDERISALEQEKSKLLDELKANSTKKEVVGAGPKGGQAKKVKADSSWHSIVEYFIRKGGIDITSETAGLAEYSNPNIDQFSGKLFKKGGIDPTKAVEDAIEEGYFRGFEGGAREESLAETIDTPQGMNKLLELLDTEMRTGEKQYAWNSKAVKLNEEIKRIDDAINNIHAEEEAIIEDVPISREDMPISPLDVMPETSMVSVDGVDMTVKQFKNMIDKDNQKISEIDKLFDLIISCKRA